MSDESRLLKAVQAIAISPEAAHELALTYRAKAEAAGASDVPHEAACMIARRYARFAGGVGGTTALMGLIPGLGTVVAATGGAVADAAASMKLQVDMTMCIAAVYGYDLRDVDAQHLSFLIAAGSALEKAGENTAIRIGSKAGVRLFRQYLKGAALQAVKAVFRKLGFVFTRKALEKAIPFGVGVVLGAGGNYVLTRFVGKQAIEWFRLDSESGGPQATLGER